MTPLRPAARRRFGWNGPGAGAWLMVAFALATAVSSAPLAQQSGTRTAPPGARSATEFTVRLSEPAANSFVFGRTRLTAEVSTQGNVKIEAVEFRVAGESIFFDEEPPYQCVHDFGEEPASWVILAVAHAADGRTREARVVTRRIEVSFRAQVNRVVLNALVTGRDEDSPATADLGREAFVLEEDGQAQKIIDFYPEHRPLSVALLMDSSGSIKEELPAVHAAAIGFVQALGEQDRAMVIEFSDKVYLLQGLTDRRDLLLEAISSTEAKGNTAYYDAVLAALRRLRKEDGRRSLVLLTDGADTSSQTTYDSLLERARLSEVVIYTVGLGSSVLDVALRSRLKDLAETTGGRAFFASKADDLMKVYETISRELSSQYYLTYEPANQRWDGRWRKISLEAREKGLKVRTREGYYGVRPGEG